MSRKPRNASDAMMIKTAKRKKVSKNPYVTYPNTEAVRLLIGIDKREVEITDKQKFRMKLLAFIEIDNMSGYNLKAQKLIKENLKHIHDVDELHKFYRRNNLVFDMIDNDKLYEYWSQIFKK